ncbi:MAG: DUF3014 domain-containing protein [Deltaproteobacteria bacterium]|nr:DUF3014 domain-containing protein [Deltaproteobacteria bacterium]
MDEVDGFEGEGQPGRRSVSKRSATPFIIAFAGLFAGMVAAWKFGLVPLPATDAQPVPVAAPAPVPVPAAEAEPPPATPEETLKGMALVRKLASELSSAPELAAWLQTPNLFQRVAAAVNLIANGENPRQPLSFLAPGGAFTAVKNGNILVMSPQSEARFDVFAHVVNGIDPVKAANAYSQVSSLFRSAFRGIAPPHTSFDATLHTALQQLASTPVPAEEPALRDTGTATVFVDPALEGLKPAQKQLLRMGPTNAKALVAWCKSFDHALGH